jgi:phenylacetate-CoA ligase
MTPGLRALASLYGVFRHRQADRAALADFQNRRLRDLVEHAYARVPYYRDLFDRAGLQPGGVRTARDLRRLPVTARRDLQEQPVDRIVARGMDPARLITRTTSGSSGQPLAIRRTWLENHILQAVRIRAMHAQGMRATDRVVTVAMDRPPSPNDRIGHVNLLRSLGLYRHRTVHCLAPPPEILDAVAASKPDILGGFGGVLARVAELALEGKGPAVRPRQVIVGGDVLTPLMRRNLHDAFRAPVLELYTCVECMAIASECPETGLLHLAEDGVIVEVLDGDVPAREGERGEVVLTNLHSFAMPFIRYRLGDIVTKGPDVCRCGQPYGTISAVQGRMIDYFQLPGGRVMHPYQIVFGLMSDTIRWMRAYRLVQEREDRVVLLAVAWQTPSDDELQRVRRSLSAALGPDVEFDVRLVPELELERTGKFRVSRSMVRSAYDGLAWNRPSMSSREAGVDRS